MSDSCDEFWKVVNEACAHKTSHECYLKSMHHFCDFAILSPTSARVAFKNIAMRTFKALRSLDLYQRRRIVIKDIADDMTDKVYHSGEVLPPKVFERIKETKKEAMRVSTGYETFLSVLEYARQTMRAFTAYTSIIIDHKTVQSELKMCENATETETMERLCNAVCRVILKESEDPVHVFNCISSFEYNKKYMEEMLDRIYITKKTENEALETRGALTLASSHFDCDELVGLIFEKLDYKAVHSCLRVCKSWNLNHVLRRSIPHLSLNDSFVHQSYIANGTNYRYVYKRNVVEIHVGIQMVVESGSELWKRAIMFRNTGENMSYGARVQASKRKRISDVKTKTDIMQERARSSKRIKTNTPRDVVCVRIPHQCFFKDPPVVKVDICTNGSHKCVSWMNGEPMFKICGYKGNKFDASGMYTAKNGVCYPSVTKLQMTKLASSSFNNEQFVFDISATGVLRSNKRGVGRETEEECASVTLNTRSMPFYIVADKQSASNAPKRICKNKDKK